MTSVLIRTGKFRHRGRKAIWRWMQGLELRSEGACLHLDFGFLAFGTMRENISVILSHQFVILCYAIAKKLIQACTQKTDSVVN